MLAPVWLSLSVTWSDRRWWADLQFSLLPSCIVRLKSFRRCGIFTSTVLWWQLRYISRVIHRKLPLLWEISFTLHLHLHLPGCSCTSFKPVFSYLFFSVPLTLQQKRQVNRTMLSPKALFDFNMRNWIVNGEKLCSCFARTFARYRILEL